MMPYQRIPYHFIITNGVIFIFLREILVFSSQDRAKLPIGSQPNDRVSINRTSLKDIFQFLILKFPLRTA